MPLFATQILPTISYLRLHCVFDAPTLFWQTPCFFPVPTMVVVYASHSGCISFSRKNYIIRVRDKWGDRENVRGRSREGGNPPPPLFVNFLTLSAFQGDRGLQVLLALLRVRLPAAAARLLPGETRSSVQASILLVHTEYIQRLLISHYAFIDDLSFAY